ncbi:MAG TPA: ribonucleoside-diphosphate reductase subunit alpha [Candidatus Babeliales bacterium]|jgi:ribonucleoside-diphosphate reductase alpha chain|nr:ribonucleoside-diphosphate reductase subunit alpha [Candidatus Babeliales bacterium]
MEQHNRVSPAPFLVNDAGEKTENNLYMFSVVKPDGIKERVSEQRLRRTIGWACIGYESFVDVELILSETLKNIFDGITPQAIADALILAATTFIERDPIYSKVTARLQLKKLFRQVTHTSIARIDSEETYRKSFVNAIRTGIDLELLDERLAGFDVEYLAQQLCLDRDNLFDYMGINTLYRRYFLKNETRYLELPQVFWMRIAMGLAYNEADKNAVALDFYNAMSTLHYVPSTPTLLHSGLTRPQLSSCFLSTVEDDLLDIFKSYSDTAMLAKWSGGVAVDWTNIRACGSMVNSIKTESQGVVPFLKINNDTIAAINRSGKRRGAAVVYLETWHLEIEDFIDLRKNTGDERRRTHDINTAHWIPDLFIKRVIADENWTLFSPEETPDLHHIYGNAFEKRYKEYEELAKLNVIKMHKTISARGLWRKMLSRLFETGHPWITFKDPCNIRSPQDHVGVVHSSNLCTEITLNTSAEEIAVCNLGSVNLGFHVNNGKLDTEKLRKTVSVAVHMLDNVIDINYYPVKETQTSNLRHRPIGLGVMGFQDLLYQVGFNFSSQETIIYADEVMELIAHSAILTSSQLAKERGAYSSYKGSKWDRNIFPQDTVDLLEQERGDTIAVGRGGKLDWTDVRNHVQTYGMRNSNVMAIAPTATIANIAGVFPSIEPIYKNIYVKANMSGEFTVVNQYLVDDLKTLGLWDCEMLELLKYYDGNVQMIERIPQILKDKYQEAFEIDPLHLINITAARGKWIDQSIAHNVFMKGVSGKQLNDIYIGAWKAGLKTTYYLRTLGASQIEKSSLDANKFGFTQKRIYKTVETVEVESAAVMAEETIASDDAIVDGKSCSISDDPECDVCQ